MSEVSGRGSARPWALLLALSGAAALTCELVWTRRLALALGSTSLAVSCALAAYMGGLGLGAWLGGRRTWARAPRGYGLLELGAAAWALAFPAILALVAPASRALGQVGGAVAAAALCLVPPAVLLGATLPAVAPLLRGRRGLAGVYAANTAGAVVGVLGATWWLLPGLGIRTTELLAAGLAAAVGLVALSWARADRLVVRPTPPEAASAPAAGGALSPGRAGLLAGTAGLCALALEVCWARLGAMLVGGSVFAFALVLAVFLGGIALGAAWARRSSRLGPQAALALLGLLTLAGSALTRVLPHLMAWSFGVLGPEAWVPLQAGLLALGMAGAPLASGIVFVRCLQGVEASSQAAAAGRILAANTLGSVLGSLGAGLLLIPLLGLRGTLLLVATLAVAVAILASTRSAQRRLAWAPALLVLLALLPGFSPRHYTAGLFLQLDRFVDLSPAAIDEYAEEGWELLYFADGREASVAVGRGTEEGGTTWLSVNGKIDASDGGDMPTQQLSGRLPVDLFLQTARATPEVLVVGLASGVTAHEALEAGAASVTVVELEPEIAVASEFFKHVNGNLLTRPRTTLVLDDARGWLQRRSRLPDTAPFEVIISEPSNPWLTGVSNLFTVEYWALTRENLAPDGVMLQWVQLYALPPQALRSLIRSFMVTYPEAWLFESIEDADALLVGAPGLDALPEGLEPQPLLGPEELRRLAAGAPLNTDDLPWVEFEAPRWVHRSTGHVNQTMLEGAVRSEPPVGDPVPSELPRDMP